MYPDELIKLTRWVGCKRDSKVPLKCLPQSEEDEPASSTNSETWCTHEDACVGMSLGYVDYLGFVFTEQDGYVAIDIDVGKDENGEMSDIAKDIIYRCKSYTEESKSGRGYHIILRGKLPFLGKNNRKGVEIYKGGRYFVMTGRNLEYDSIITNQEAIDYVVSTYFPDYRPSTENESNNRNCFYEIKYGKAKKGRISLKPIYPTVKVGSRNLSMLSLAAQFKAKGLSRKEVYCKVLKINSVCCKPPLDPNEIMTVVESCFKYK